MIAPTIVPIFTLLFGLAFGSFLNVCIARLPWHRSIVHPPSHCPGCKTPIRSRDNIPLLSYLILRGRCRACRTPISWRYPAVELANALLWLACLLQFGLTLQGVGMAVLCFLLLGLAVMDAETLRLPDAFTLPGIALGLAWTAVTAPTGSRLATVLHAALWSFAATVLLLAIALGYRAVRGRSGLGIGDAKLLAMLAAWLGPASALLILFLGVVMAAIYGFVLLVSRRANATTRIPLGAFLSLAALYAIFAGPDTIHWYLHLFL
ncbi:prepilin peptidase [Silvibacterium dinghuense]|uniref:Prepilin leader peptidase/N-methyltransferase n=2 Tax=Silvibacterium dinghuense TaxID=1560006 RepID=A0A4Q1SKQ1_9BACT|nr:prepilin peptidase [Silvibacterium dinghuense]GGG90452.1 type 4 prepilin-like proteins leader peptide-processing enzyme [Silvibacterium dinghuense]